MRIRRVKDSLLTGSNLSKNIVFLFAVLILSCRPSVKEKLAEGGMPGKIIYDTYIINRDSTDLWGDECLSKFDREAFIDEVFKAVFEGKIIPLDYFSGEKISLDRIRKMEADGEFARKNISKIQFEECWIWDKKLFSLQKRVISMTIAYEVYDNTGKSRGQKPIFKLKFNPE
ncbi:MAG: hypothetical protein WCL21_08935 [Mariniphaga sp.]